MPRHELVEADDWTGVGLIWKKKKRLQTIRVGGEWAKYMLAIAGGSAPFAGTSKLQKKASGFANELCQRVFLLGTLHLIERNFRHTYKPRGNKGRQV